MTEYRRSSRSLSCTVSGKMREFLNTASSPLRKTAVYTTLRDEEDDSDRYPSTPSTTTTQLKLQPSQTRRASIRGLLKDDESPAVYKPATPPTPPPRPPGPREVCLVQQKRSPNSRERVVVVAKESVVTKPHHQQRGSCGDISVSSIQEMKHKSASMKSLHQGSKNYAIKSFPSVSSDNVSYNISSNKSFSTFARAAPFREGLETQDVKSYKESLVLVSLDSDGDSGDHSDHLSTSAIPSSRRASQVIPDHQTFHERALQCSERRQRLDEIKRQKMTIPQRCGLLCHNFKKALSRLCHGGSKQSCSCSGRYGNSPSRCEKCRGSRANDQSQDAKSADYICLEPKHDESFHVFHRFKRKWKFLHSNPGVCFMIVTVILLVCIIYGARKMSRIFDNMHRKGVYVKCGMVHGLYHDGVHVFKGIPYALSPDGHDRRWMPPVPYDQDSCWQEPYVADKFGPACCQVGHTDEECEDCLYLNVWTPKLPTSTEDKGLPVMVYIHGGGLISGSGNQPGYSPTPEVARETNMVYVSFNYRLNVFGFLALRELSELPRKQGEDPRGTSGNYGYMDQVMALNWVQKNIAGFGGDPSKVTIFGLDSGATSIMALISTKETKGLFNRAWLMSPSPRFDANLQSLEKAEHQNEQGFLQNAKRLMCEDSTGKQLLSCLLGMSPMDLINATDIQKWRNPQYWWLPEKNENATVIAIVDGKFLSDAPHEAWRKGTISPVPLLVGNTAQEVARHMQPPGLRMWNITAYQRYIIQKLPSYILPDAVFQMYPIKRTLSAAKQLMSMISDMRLICGTDEKFKVAANKSKLPVYRYVVEDMEDSKNQDQARYAFQGLDAAVFFGRLDDIELNPSDKVLSLQHKLRQMIMDFARTGELNEWQTFPGYTRLFNGQTDSVDVYHREACNFWRENAMFPAYAWIN